MKKFLTFSVFRLRTLQLRYLVIKSSQIVGIFAAMFYITLVPHVEPTGTTTFITWAISTNHPKFMHIRNSTTLLKQA